MSDVYRGLANTAAHLHLMIRDAFDAGRYCPNENRAQHSNIRQWVFSKLIYWSEMLMYMFNIVIRLAGKVEMLMCLAWPSAVNEGLDLFNIVKDVLETNVHRYYDCSARYTLLKSIHSVIKFPFFLLNSVLNILQGNSRLLGGTLCRSSSQRCQLGRSAKKRLK